MSTCNETHSELETQIGENNFADPDVISFDDEVYYDLPETTTFMA